MLLVGDSLGQVMLGYETTVRVTMEEMLHHTKAVVRGAHRALVVGDMPFLSYATPDDAVRNAGGSSGRPGRRRSRSRAACGRARVIETLVRAGVPVMGHIGLHAAVDQRAGQGPRPGPRPATRRGPCSHDALAVQEAGAFAVVLELVPEQLAAAITAAAANPDDRDRRRGRLLGPGPGRDRLPGPRQLHPPPRQAVRRPAWDDPRRPRRPTGRTWRRDLPGCRRSRAAWTMRSSTRSWATPPDDRTASGTQRIEAEDPARPRPLIAATCRSSGVARSCAARSPRCRDRSAWSRRWAGSTPATPR